MMNAAPSATDIWAQSVGPEWRSLCREIVFSAVKLAAVEARAAALIEKCPDPFSVALPMANIIGGRSVTEIPLAELTKAAITTGVATADEIRKAQAPDLPQKKQQGAS